MERDFQDDEETTRLQSGPVTFVFAEKDFEILERTPSLQEAFRQRTLSRDNDFGYHSFYSQSHCDDVQKTPPDLLLQKLDEMVAQKSSSKKVRDIESLVENYVGQILQDMKEMDKRWDFILIKCGSYYEELRIGHPFEFDYMLHIVTLEATDIKTDEARPLDSFHVKFSSLIDDSRDAEFKTKMIPALRECIRRRDNFRGLKFLEVLDHYNKPNICLFFQLKDIGIMIDLVPCVKFPYSQRSILPPYLDEALVFASKVIPGAETKDKVSSFISSNLYLVATNIHSRWRISTSVVELHIMRHLPEELKKPLRVLKYLCNTHLVHSESFTVRHTDSRTMLKLFGYKPFLPSYIIKLLFLLHVSEFYNERMCQAPGMYHNDTTGLLQSVIRDLKRFKACTSSPVDLCRCEIFSTFFGESYKHKFDFVQHLVFRNVSQSIGWYDQMVNTMELILDEEITDSDIPQLKQKFRLINYPPLEDVRCFVSTSNDL